MRLETNALLDFSPRYTVAVMGSDEMNATPLEQTLPQCACNNIPSYIQGHLHLV